MKVCAVVDIGTLKVKFLIAFVASSGELREIYSSNTLTCFGCEMDKNEGNVLEANLIKTINELKRCKKLLEKYKIGKFKVVSTHAMRRAKNKDEIISRIKKEVGFNVENISQEQEAELFFRAVIRDFPDTLRERAVIDIGGGSVQVLIGNSEKLKKVHTMQSGAQFLHDNFTKDPSNPKSFTTPRDIERMKKHILKELLPFKRRKNTPIVYGSSNIIDMMKAVSIPLRRNKNAKNHPYKTYVEYLDEFIKKILPLNYEEREKLFKFQKGYMWGIDKAFLNVTLIANHLESSFIIPSNENIAKGIIYTLA